MNYKELEDLDSAGSTMLRRVHEMAPSGQIELCGNLSSAEGV